MRLFLAINLPATERDAIWTATAPMRAAAARVTWVRRDAMHLTMKFFGEVAEPAAAALADALAAPIAAHAPLRLDLGGLGAFPNLRAPRIVWLGVEQDPRLELLHNDIETTCAALGYEVDGRAFRPHLTLGRVKDRIAAPAARALAAAARGVRYHGTAEVETVDLMASRLTPAGPVYTRIAAVAFGGR